MAIPRPASDRIEMDFRTMAGISKFHLQDDTNKTPSIDRDGTAPCLVVV
jgi:hypothetical protein